MSAPPPPPHGEAPRSSGLPPGRYDIFVIPEHSAGSGFLYLPSMKPSVNSFVAGFASALILVALFQSMAPAFRVWWEGFQGLGNMGFTMLIFGVGFGAWVLGRTQNDRPSPSGPGPQGGNPGQGGFGASNSAPPPHTGASSSSAPPPPPPPPRHGGSSHAPPPPPPPPPPRPQPPNDAPPPPQQEKPKASWQESPKEPETPKTSWQEPPQQPEAPKADTPKPEPPKPEPPKSEPPKPETPKPETPKPEAPKSNGTWEKAREEMRKKEEERKAKAAEAKRREEVSKRLAELRAKEAKERLEREKEKERRQKEKEKELADQRRKEAAEKLKREKAEQAAQNTSPKKESTATTATANSNNETSTPRSGSYAFSRLGEKTNMWPNGRPSVPPSETGSFTSKTSRNTPREEKRPPAPTARTYVSADEDAYSFRPYDQPKTHKRKPSESSFGESEASWAPSQTTAQTTPTPSVRGPYSTKDPDKIVIQAVYLFMNQFAKMPASQLISGVGSVTDGLILRITTEGLFIDDDVRGVPQREWDVKAWTLKKVEVWCPPHCLSYCTATTCPNSASGAAGDKKNPPHVLYKTSAMPRNAGRDGSKAMTGDEADEYLIEMLRACNSCCRLGLCQRKLRNTDIQSPSGQTGEWRAKGLHVLRATVRDLEGKRYMFVLDETESWKVAVGLQRLRRGTQVRQLGVVGMSPSEARGALEMLGWCH